MNYRQCKLKKGALIQISWIPDKLATIGAILKLKTMEIWDNGWIITEVYAQRPESKVLLNRDDYRYHRMATDI